MSSTRYSMGEQVKERMAAQGKQAGTDIRVIYKSIEQVLNGLLKIDYFKTTLDVGDTAPDGLSIATYENIPVVSYNNSAKLTLPANYQRLPRGLGIYYLGPQDPAPPLNELTAQFIPIPMGQAYMLAGQPLISDLFGQIAYEAHGLDIIFTTDITKAPYAITECRAKLVVLDLSQYGDYTLLPIPADMEAAAVEQVTQMFLNTPPPARIDDPITVKAPGK